VYIVELGAGSGRFGYRFVKRLSFLLERSSITHKSFTYVMTDAAASMIDYWQAHPSLRPLVDAGVLDFAHFDATRQTDIQQGDIMVCEMTVPTWVPLFATVSAIVADSGGVLCHCAIVAREFGLPAVVGTHVGTHVLRDGMTVTVDGTRGIVRIDSH
jgi:phosphohistidine swiveling domain-containing protein